MPRLIVVSTARLRYQNGLGIRKAWVLERYSDFRVYRSRQAISAQRVLWS